MSDKQKKKMDYLIRKHSRTFTQRDIDEMFAEIHRNVAKRLERLRQGRREKRLEVYPW